MSSLSYSLLEVSSSIVQKTGDEFDSILHEVESCSLDMLMRKSEKRANIFSSNQVEVSKVRDRIHVVRKKHEDVIDALQKRISELEILESEKSKEIASLEDYKNELEEKRSQLSARIEDLQQKKHVMISTLQIYKEFSDSISSGFHLIQRIDEQKQCSFPERSSNT